MPETGPNPTPTGIKEEAMSKTPEEVEAMYHEAATVREDEYRAITLQEEELRTQLNALIEKSKNEPSSSREESKVRIAQWDELKTKLSDLFDKKAEIRNERGQAILAKLDERKGAIFGEGNPESNSGKDTQ
jgi:Glu-tRNA(Gln) amidotransferase subunit E-like FAD-binding protein